MPATTPTALIMTGGGPLRKTRLERSVMEGREILLLQLAVIRQNNYVNSTN